MVYTISRLIFKNLNLKRAELRPKLLHFCVLIFVNHIQDDVFTYF